MPLRFSRLPANRLLVSLALTSLAAPAFAQEDSAELPEITVTAPSLISPIGAPVRPAPHLPEGLRPIVANVFAPVTLLTQNELAAASGATLGDRLSQLPGLAASGYTAGASRPIIRGLDNARVRLQENGIGVMDVSAIGEDHGVPIDPLAADRIEIIRGPATLRWGSQAIGGVVSASNNRIPGMDTPEGFHGQIKGGISSADKDREGAMEMNARSGSYAIHADAFTRRAEDFRTPFGIQPNTFVQAQGQSIGTSYFFPGGFVGVAFSRYASLYGIPGAEPAASGTRINLEQTKLTTKGEYRVGSAFIDTIRFWAGTTHYKHDETGLNAGVRETAATFKNREQEARVEVQLNPFNTPLGPWRTAIGLDVGHQNLGTSGDAGGLLSPSETTRAAVYIFNRLDLSKTWHFETAARLGMSRAAGTSAAFPAGFLPNGNPVVETSRTRHFLPGSVSAGVLKDLPNDVVASLTAQYVQRAPEALELFSKGPHDATSTFEIGNATLKKEGAGSIELGLRRAVGAFRFDASLFHTRYNGYISKRLTGTLCGDTFDTCGVDTELKQLVYTQRNARFTGAEFSGELDVMALGHGTFGVSGQYDIVRARFADGSVIPRLPPQRLGAGLFWRDANWLVRGSYLHAFDQTKTASEETRTKGYNLVKAEVSYTHKFTGPTGASALTIGLVGNNLLNDDIRNSVSFKKDEVLAPGRDIRLFARMRF